MTDVHILAMGPLQVSPDEARRLFDELAAFTVDQPGVLAYSLRVDGDGTRGIIEEHYADFATFEAHMAAMKTNRGFRTVASLLTVTDFLVLDGDLERIKQRVGPIPVVGFRRVSGR
jgi:quinol monooxygenase YgiN